MPAPTNIRARTGTATVSSAALLSAVSRRPDSAGTGVGLPLAVHLVEKQRTHASLQQACAHHSSLLGYHSACTLWAAPVLLASKTCSGSVCWASTACCPAYRACTQQARVLALPCSL